jgi:hypothetical protein
MNGEGKLISEREKKGVSDLLDSTKANTKSEYE